MERQDHQADVRSQENRKLSFVVQCEGKLLELIRKECSLSLKCAKRMVDRGFCTVNERIERVSTRLVTARSRIAIAAEAFLEPKSHLIYQDRAIALFDKAPDLVSDDSRWWKAIVPAAEPVHRLDKGTSGLLLMACTAEAKNSLEGQFFERQVGKAYLAWVEGRVSAASGCIAEPLIRDYGEQRGGEIVMRLARREEKGLSAETSWECIERGEKSSLLLCFPKSGRTHQLRVHLSSIGHPIIGDSRYGSGAAVRRSLSGESSGEAFRKKPEKRGIRVLSDSFDWLEEGFSSARRPLLHAAALTFIHPERGERETFFSLPPPADFPLLGRAAERQWLEQRCTVGMGKRALS